MYYKYKSDTDMKPAPNAAKKITTLKGGLCYCPSVEQLNENNYFAYVAPTLTKYQKLGKLIKVDETITNEVDEMTPAEKHAADIAQRAIELNWQYTNMNFRVICPFDYLISPDGAIYVNPLWSKILAMGLEVYNLPDTPEANKNTQYANYISKEDYDFLKTLTNVTMEVLDSSKPSIAATGYAWRLIWNKETKVIVSGARLEDGSTVFENFDQAIPSFYDPETQGYFETQDANDLLDFISSENLIAE